MMGGWNLPDGVTDDMIPGNRPGDDHDSRCKAHEDAPLVWSECGGVGACECYGPGWLAATRRWLQNMYELYRWGELTCHAQEDPECDCAELADDDAASAADHAEDVARERRENW